VTGAQGRPLPVVPAQALQNFSPTSGTRLRRKRGGGAPAVPLDEVDAESRFLPTRPRRLQRPGMSGTGRSP